MDRARFVVCVHAAHDLRHLIGQATIAAYLAGQAALKPAPLAIDIEAVLKARAVALDAGERFDDVGLGSH